MSFPHVLVCGILDMCISLWLLRAYVKYLHNNEINVIFDEPPIPRSADCREDTVGQLSV